MRRASTPRHEFHIPIDASLIRKLRVTYTQGDQIILEKTETDMTANGNVWSVTLTQEETNRFYEGDAQAQVRYVSAGGQADASEFIPLYVEPVSNDEVL